MIASTWQLIILNFDFANWVTDNQEGVSVTLGCVIVAKGLCGRQFIDMYAYYVEWWLQQRHKIFLILDMLYLAVGAVILCMCYNLNDKNLWNELQINKLWSDSYLTLFSVWWIMQVRVCVGFKFWRAHGLVFGYLRDGDLHTILEE